MEASRVTGYAHALYHAHGDVAEAEAAQKARRFAEAGRANEAEDWRAVRIAIRQMRGALQS
ncbi:hypothetical protein K3554_10230 [Jannaschia sp. W003]|nr:hypothetical protein [Jannaschia sp. W003]UWQ20374.1 hypothetical protein K3554_10230 [Jannaschia sp. W003]